MAMCQAYRSTTLAKRKHHGNSMRVIQTQKWLSLCLCTYVCDRHTWKIKDVLHIVLKGQIDQHEKFWCSLLMLSDWNQWTLFSSQGYSHRYQIPKIRLSVKCLKLKKKKNNNKIKSLCEWPQSMLVKTSFWSHIWMKVVHNNANGWRVLKVTSNW